MSNNEDKSNLPLPLFWKVMIFILPFSLLGAGLPINLTKAYKRNHEEALAWAIWGIITWTVIALIYIVLTATP